MWPYFVPVLSVLMLQMKIGRESVSKIQYMVAFFILFCFAAFRGNGDYDYFAYIQYSRYVTSLGDVFRNSIPMEIGFRAISYFVNILGVHQQFVIMIMNFISLACIYKFILKYSPDRIFSVLLFLPLYFQYDMHGARAAVAIGIGTLSAQYLYDKKVLKYLAIVFLASTFHKSALILIPMYFIGNIKVDKVLGILSILVLTLLTRFVSFSKIILVLLNLLSLDTLAYKFGSYMQSIRFGYAFKLYDPRFILVVGIYVVATIILDKSDKLQNLFINYVWVNALLMIIFHEHTVFVTRLTAYFNIYTIILIPYIVSYFRKPQNISSYYLVKLSAIYIYIPYITRFLIGAVEYKLFFF